MYHINNKLNYVALYIFEQNWKNNTFVTVIMWLFKQI